MESIWSAVRDFLHAGFFFFQAEDGIRDDLVTGVQTCALPISVTRRFAVVAVVARVAKLQRNLNFEARNAAKNVSQYRAVFVDGWGKNGCKLDRKSVV